MTLDILAWTNSQANVSWARSVGNEFIEFAVSLTNLTNPRAVYVCGCIIDETPFAERAFASFPNSFAGNAYYPSIVWGTYYGLHNYYTQVDLLDSLF